MEGTGHVLGHETIYWCTLCNALHTRTIGSDEYIMATAFRTIGGTHFSIGFCNVAHGEPINMQSSKIPKMVPA